MKTRRHKLIREIIEQQNIETQYQLTEALAKYGMNVTQSTISRDIKDLGLVKIATGVLDVRYITRLCQTADRLHRQIHAGPGRNIVKKDRNLY